MDKLPEAVDHVPPGAIHPSAAEAGTSHIRGGTEAGASPIPSDPQRLAELTVAGMLATDAASRSLGMQLTAVGPGHATVTMVVRADMLNGFGMCHGGLITALADSAFAFACNSHGELTVAAALSVDFITPAHAGDVLTVACHEVSRSGRTGVYDATVVNQHGGLVAVFRGRSYRPKSQSPLS